MCFDVDPQESIDGLSCVAEESPIGVETSCDLETVYHMHLMHMLH